MFSIPGLKVISLTDAAATRIHEIMAQASKGEAPALGLRVGVKKGGCAGMEYTMELADTAQPGDEVIEQGEARVLIAPTAQMFIFGTEIDYESGLLESGFKFRNPNVTDSCGCGESVSFAPLEGSRATQP